MSRAELATLLFDRLLLLYLSGTIILIGLLFGWDRALGRAMARFKMAFALVFVGALLAAWFPFFVSQHWRWFLRVALSITATAVLWHFKLRYGGWAPMLLHAWRNLKQWPELFRWHRGIEDP